MNPHQRLSLLSGLLLLALAATMALLGLLQNAPALHVLAALNAAAATALLLRARRIAAHG